MCAFAAGKPEPLTFVLGLTHGLLWIFMSLVCITAARLRVVSLRLAVAVAVLGGIGPFFGSYEFVREQPRHVNRPVAARGRLAVPSRARVRSSMATGTTAQQTIDVVTPAAGESVTEGTILEWHVKVGDAIKARRDDRRDLHRQGRRRAALARDAARSARSSSRRATRSPSGR